MELQEKINLVDLLSRLAQNYNLGHQITDLAAKKLAELLETL